MCMCVKMCAYLLPLQCMTEASSRSLSRVTGLTVCGSSWLYFYCDKTHPHSPGSRRASRWSSSILSLNLTKTNEPTGAHSMSPPTHRWLVESQVTEKDQRPGNYLYNNWHIKCNSYFSMYIYVTQQDHLILKQLQHTASKVCDFKRNQSNTPE